MLPLLGDKSMQIGTGKSILNGIAIGKIKIYKAPKMDISSALITDTEAEVSRFDDAVEKAIDQQNALYEKALSHQTSTAFEYYFLYYFYNFLLFVHIIIFHVQHVDLQNIIHFQFQL